MRFLAALTIAKAAEHQHDLRLAAERDRERTVRPHRWLSR
jgi:hypothetical protein